ncbi:hypothetical protein TIFTF001_009707 [Ficus carica]|uniref:Uncharacterized protein n=1 Tax=Ficus carica TaxID=3494 RepID=A0AA87ZVH7_FICCA|nr:hypothetical protein TIFTF001_009707 [Ficus carica]
MGLLNGMSPSHLLLSNGLSGDMCTVRGDVRNLTSTVMSATMDNLLKMFKAARETAGESSGTTPSAAEVEALLVCSAALMAEDDDPRYVG